jgi:hypothetical protein
VTSQRAGFIARRASLRRARVVTAGVLSPSDVPRTPRRRVIAAPTSMIADWWWAGLFGKCPCRLSCAPLTGRQEASVASPVCGDFNALNRGKLACVEARIVSASMFCRMPLQFEPDLLRVHARLVDSATHSLVLAF